MPDYYSKPFVYFNLDFYYTSCGVCFDDPVALDRDEPDIGWIAPRGCPVCGSEDYTDCDVSAAISYIQAELRWARECLGTQDKPATAFKTLARIEEQLEELRRLI